MQHQICPFPTLQAFRRAKHKAAMNVCKKIASGHIYRLACSGPCLEPSAAGHWGQLIVTVLLYFCPGVSRATDGQHRAISKGLEILLSINEQHSAAVTGASNHQGTSCGLRDGVTAASLGPPCSPQHARHWPPMKSYEVQHVQHAGVRNVRHGLRTCVQGRGAKLGPPQQPLMCICR